MGILTVNRDHYNCLKWGYISKIDEKGEVIINFVILEPLGISLQYFFQISSIQIFL